MGAQCCRSDEHIINHDNGYNIPTAQPIRPTATYIQGSIHKSGNKELATSQMIRTTDRDIQQIIEELLSSQMNLTDRGVQVEGNRYFVVKKGNTYDGNSRNNNEPLSLLYESYRNNINDDIQWVKYIIQKQQQGASLQQLSLPQTYQTLKVFNRILPQTQIQIPQEASEISVNGIIIQNVGNRTCAVLDTDENALLTNYHLNWNNNAISSSSRIAAGKNPVYAIETQAAHNILKIAEEFYSKLNNLCKQHIYFKPQAFNVSNAYLINNQLRIDGFGLLDEFSMNTSFMQASFLQESSRIAQNVNASTLTNNNNNSQIEAIRAIRLREKQVVKDAAGIVLRLLMRSSSYQSIEDLSSQEQDCPEMLLNFFQNITSVEPERRSNAAEAAQQIQLMSKNQQVVEYIVKKHRDS